MIIWLTLSTKNQPSWTIETFYSTFKSFAFYNRFSYEFYMLLTKAWNLNKYDWLFFSLSTKKGQPILMCEYIFFSQMKLDWKCILAWWNSTSTSSVINQKLFAFASECSSLILINLGACWKVELTESRKCTTYFIIWDGM